MKNISALRRLWRFRSLRGSTSMAIKAVNPTEEKLIRDHLSKKLIRGQGSVKNYIDMVVLRKLMDHASKFLNDKVTKAVVTVPAYFNDSQRTATKDPGRIAGLEVPRIINEPSTAFLAYDFEKKNNETNLVFDLGAGNFDVSVLEVGDGVFEVLSTSGDTHLGGDDFDRRIVDWLTGNFENDEHIDLLKDKQALKRLTEAAEKAKTELSTLTQTNISLPFITATAYDPKHIGTTLTRAKFEELCSDILDRLRTPVQNALRDANMQFKDIDEVILVGGSTRIPVIQELVKKMTGKDPNVTVNPDKEMTGKDSNVTANPDEVVALGASVQNNSNYVQEQQSSYMLNTNWSFPRRFHGTTQLDLGKKRKDSINQKFPGNTARIVLNPDDLTESKRSYLNGIRKIQEWCKATSTSIDVSSYFGPGAKVYPTPENGTFHLTFVYKEHEITFFIYGRNLYIKGWQVDDEIFEIREKDDSTSRFIQDPRCILMNIGVNYNRLCKDGHVGNVRIGFKAMTDNIEVLLKSKSMSTDVMQALACFAVHGPEAVRFEWVLEDILESFESSLNLDSKRSLSNYVWNYSYYSSVYLQCADCIANGQQVPKITNRPPGDIKDLHELRSLIRIPLRTARKKFSKKDKSKKEPPEPCAVWSPPYADGNDWHLKEEEQEGNKTNLEEGAEPEQKSEVQLEDQEAVETEVKDQPNLEEYAGGSIMTRHFSVLNAGSMSFENDRAGEYRSIGIRCPSQNTSDMMNRGVQINSLAGLSGHRRWLRISRFLRWFIR